MNRSFRKSLKWVIKLFVAFFFLDKNFLENTGKTLKAITTLCPLGHVDEVSHINIDSKLCGYTLTGFNSHTS